MKETSQSSLQANRRLIEAMRQLCGYIFSQLEAPALPISDAWALIVVVVGIDFKSEAFCAFTRVWQSGRIREWGGVGDMHAPRLLTATDWRMYRKGALFLLWLSYCHIDDDDDIIHINSTFINRMEKKKREIFFPAHLTSSWRHIRYCRQQCALCLLHDWWLFFSG
jgi:hypothetical protein